jgi:hypothetical protein
MKILLFLLLTLPVYSQTDREPCNPAQEHAGKQAITALKQFKGAYKNPVTFCSNGDLVLSMDAKRVSSDLLVTAVHDKLKPQIAAWGLTRLVIEAQGWDRTPKDTVHSVTPTTVITTRSGSSTVSTVTGGNVVSRERYTYRREGAIAIIEL